MNSTQEVKLNELGILIIPKNFQDASNFKTPKNNNNLITLTKQYIEDDYHITIKCYMSVTKEEYEEVMGSNLAEYRYNKPTLMENGHTSIVDDFGRVLITREVRDMLNIMVNDVLVLDLVDEDTISIYKRT